MGQNSQVDSDLPGGYNSQHYADLHVPSDVQVMLDDVIAATAHILWHIDMGSCTQCAYSNNSSIF